MNIRTAGPPGWTCRLLGVPGKAHLLEDESFLQARQRELLAGRQGCRSRGRIRRKPQAKRRLDEQESHRGGHAGQEGNYLQSPIAARKAWT